MLRGSWNNNVANGLIILLSIGAIFYVGWTFIELKTQQRVSEHYERYSQGQVSEKSIAASCGNLANAALSICAIQQYEESHKWSQERRDLHAQESMALWAFWMFITTAAAFVAIMRTLHYTRIAAEQSKIMASEAHSTTEAALKSADVAERALIEIERPWLFFTGAIIQEMHIVTQIGGQPERAIIVSIPIKNFGRSPAFNVNTCRIGIIAHAQSPIAFGVLPEMPPNKMAIVGPNAQGTAQELTYFGDVVDRIIRGEVEVFVWARVEYSATPDGRMLYTESCTHNAARVETDYRGNLVKIQTKTGVCAGRNSAA